MNVKRLPHIYTPLLEMQILSCFLSAGCNEPGRGEYVMLGAVCHSMN